MNGAALTDHYADLVAHGRTQTQALHRFAARVYSTAGVALSELDEHEGVTSGPTVESLRGLYALAWGLLLETKETHADTHLGSTDRTPA